MASTSTPPRSSTCGGAWQPPTSSGPWTPCGDHDAEEDLVTDLDGRVAVVTGAAGGIGAGIAAALADAGAAVGVWDLDGGRAKEDAAGIGGRALGVEVDITSRPGVEAAVAAPESAFGPVD